MIQVKAQEENGGETHTHTHTHTLTHSHTHTLHMFINHFVVVLNKRSSDIMII